MLLSAVSILVVAQLSSEIPEGLMNNPVYIGTIHPSIICLCVYYVPTYLPTYLPVNISAHPSTRLQSLHFLCVFCLSFSVYLVISSCYVIIRVRKRLSCWYYTQHYGGSVCGIIEVESI